MRSVEENEWASLEYWNPEILLTRLFPLKVISQSRNQPKRIRHWNAQPLKKYKEQEQAALFCYCVNELGRVGEPFEVAMAPRRDADYDCVIRQKGTEGHFEFRPVQLKEWVPQEVNPTATLQGLLEELRTRYPVSKRLLVAVFINRDVVFDLSQVRIQPLTVEQVWLYRLKQENQIAVNAFRSDGERIDRALPYPQLRIDLLRPGRELGS